MSAFEPGGLIGDRYELGRQLGAGGMARVYLAHDRLLDREVALKVLSERYASDPAFVERFRREASAAAGLNHPNIVSIYDRGETDGNYYIVMEYLDGPDLKAVIRRRGPLPADESIDYALQILAALGAAHRRDIIHRDIKPQNVMVAEDGRLKVTDFGIARAGSQSAMTEVGAVIGTAQYLSPEQAKGEDVTAASDCYSVGIVLYEMLTGRLPFEAERAVAVAMKQINEPPVPPQTYEPSIPDSLNVVVMRALEKRPASRYRTAEELSHALQAVRRELGGETGTLVLGAAPAQGTAQTRVLGPEPPTATTRVQPRGPQAPRRAAALPPPPPPERRRRYWPWVLGLVVLLLLAAGAVAFVLSGGDGGTDEPQGPRMVAVPSVEGRTPVEATRLLKDAGFVVDLVRQANDAEESTVLGTRPSAGAMANEGSTVDLLVSSGPATVRVPGVVGLPIDDARAALTRALFAVDAVDAFSEVVAEGLVISQDPAAESQAASESSVTLTVSKGAEPVSVPDVRRISIGAARTKLEAEGLRLGNVTSIPNEEFPPDTVVDQSPGPTSVVEPGSAVDVVVAEAIPDRPVPSVIGLDFQSARDKLESLGYTVTSSEGEPQNGEAAGIVIDQTPRPDTIAPPDQNIVIIVSSGPPIVEPPPPTETAPPPIETVPVDPPPTAPTAPTP